MKKNMIFGTDFEQHRPKVKKNSNYLSNLNNKESNLSEKKVSVVGVKKDIILPIGQANILFNK